MLAVVVLVSRLGLPKLEGYVVPGASYRGVATSACPGRLLLTEQKVLYAQISASEQLLMRLHVAPTWTYHLRA